MQSEVDQRVGAGSLLGEWSRNLAAVREGPAANFNEPSDLETMRREFDEAFYRAHNPELDFETTEPLVHFAAKGWREGRDPAPWFSVADYLAQHEDVRKIATNPFLHYLLHGRRQGRHVAGSRAGLAAPQPEPPVAPPADASKLRGKFERIRGGLAEGWAFDGAQPDSRLTVELWLGPKLLCVVTADAERDDLKDAGIGDGRHSFAIRLPRLAPQDEPADITARIAGADFILGTLSADIADKGLHAVIEQVSGLTLTAIFTAQLELAGTAVDVLIDGQMVAAIATPPLPAGASFKAMARLPDTALDGQAHWFRLALADSKVALADEVLRTDIVGTPEDALQAYAKSFPGFLSANAQRRYIALERQMAMAPKLLARQAPGADRLSLEAYLAQLSRAHAQVQRGVGEQKTKPAPLTALRFEAPEVSVVVPAHNKFWVTYNCLAALLLAPNEATFEIIVVDDGSSDLTVDLPEIVNNIVYIRNETALGFVKSSNKGAEAARGRYVVMLNNDTEPGPGWIDELLYVFKTFPDAGLAGAKLIYPNGRLQEAGGIVFADFDVWNYGRDKNPYEPRFNYTRQVDYVSGACIMIPRPVWEKLGGFDEFYAPAYFEDTDLAFRIRALGMRTYYAPFAEVVHFEGLSNGVTTASGMKRYQVINEPKFRRRWASVIRQLPHSEPELAKDRGVELRALVIDHKTPEPDNDAGSYAALQEMRLLQKLGFKLTFVPQNLAYLGNYTQHLQRQGVECLYAPYQSSIEETIRRRGPEFDIFYITRYKVAAAFIDEIRASAPRAKIVFCNADLHFLREIRAAILGKSSDALSAALATRDAELAVMRRVDVTLSYSETEAAVILSHNLDSTKVARCPWVVEVAQETPPFAARSGVAFLGGFQHAPNEEAVRLFVEDIMPKLRLARPGLTLHIYGSHIGETIRRLASDDVVVEGYVDDVAEVYDRHRIFIAPLRSGAGLKGKVAGALAAGAPTVMTSLAAEGIGVSRGVEAIVVDAVNDWVDAIVSLYDDEARWTEMSVRAKRFARENFSFERGVETMRAALAAGGVYVGE
jgi:GT2 family glycosyltransferase